MALTSNVARGQPEREWPARQAAETANGLQQIGDSVPVALDRAEMIGRRFARDTAEMTAPGISREGQVGDAGRFPKADRVAPFGFVADATRNPRNDADTGRIAAFRLGTGAQFGKCGGR